MSNMSNMQEVLAKLRSAYPGLARAATRTPVKAIRLFCLDCQGGSPKEVNECTSSSCPLPPFRRGVGFKREMTAEQRETCAANLRARPGVSARPRAAGDLTPGAREDAADGVWQGGSDDVAGDVAAFLATIIDDHPAGWSTLNMPWSDSAPGYGNPGPNCYCHGSRSEEANEITEATAAACGGEWGYVFDAVGTMWVVSSYSVDGRKMIGMFGYGDPEASWRVKAEVRLDDPEPDWEAIEQGDEQPEAEGSAS